MRCNICRAVNPAGKKFCGECGAPLSQPASQAPEKLAPVDGGRRKIIFIGIAAACLVCALLCFLSLGQLLNYGSALQTQTAAAIAVVSRSTATPSPFSTITPPPAPTNSPKPTQKPGETVTPIPASVPSATARPTVTSKPSPTIMPSATTTKTAVPKPLSPASLSESEYATAVGDISKDFKSAFTDLADRMTQVSDNPELLLDENWRVKTALNVVLIKDCNKRVRALKPPTKYTVSHASMIEAANHFDKAMDSLVYGLDNLDVDSLKQALDQIALGNTDVQRATSQLQ